MTELHHHYTQKTVQDIVNLFRGGHLNLSPGFQRNSVWTERDRAKLIDSITRQYPLPAIFLYRREENGEILYDVIDGKQRIESILMYMGVLRGGRYFAKLQLDNDEKPEWYDWRILARKKLKHLITGYNLATIEVDGDLSDIIDLFVRINSTGKALTSSEKRHARYYNSEFLRVASKLATRYENFFYDNEILTIGQISRMKHVELISELMLSIHQGEVLNKKSVLDRVMQSGNLTLNQTRKAESNTILSINRIKRMFPKLYLTRFKQMSDFYSLVVLLSKFEDEKLILTNKRRNKLAWEILIAFSNGVDIVRGKHKRLENISEHEETYRQYLDTVIRGTDELQQRLKRQQILRSLLQSLFERKDSNRLFTSEQRRLLWNISLERKCKACRRVLSWEDFTIDHIDPYSKGGKSKLDNAALMCRSCNSKKGNRKRRYYK